MNQQPATVQVVSTECTLILAEGCHPAVTFETGELRLEAGRETAIPAELLDFVLSHPGVLQVAIPTTAPSEE